MGMITDVTSKELEAEMKWASRTPDPEILKWMEGFTNLKSDKGRWEATIRETHKLPPIWQDSQLARGFNVASYVMTITFGGYELELVYFKDGTAWRNPAIQ